MTVDGAIDGTIDGTTKGPISRAISAPVNEAARAPDLGPPTTLVLIRHAHTDETGQVLTGGDGPGPDLNATGHQVAALLASVLADLPASTSPDELTRPQAVITSPAARASQTAGLVAAGLGLAPVTDDDWNEVRVGDWQSQSLASIIATWPDEYAAWRESSDVVPPNGESYDQLALRVAKAADHAVAAHHRQTVAIVSHVGPIRALLSAALRADPVAARRLRINPGSISVLRLWADGECEVSAVNATPSCAQPVLVG